MRSLPFCKSRSPLSFKKGILGCDPKHHNSRQVLAESVSQQPYSRIFSGRKQPQGYCKQWKESAQQCLPGEMRQTPTPAAVPAPSGGWGLDMPISSIPGTQSCFLPGSKHSADAESPREPRAPLMVVMTCSQTEGAKSAWGPSGFSTGLGSHLFLTSPGVPCALHTALSSNSASGQGSPQLFEDPTSYLLVNFNKNAE